MEIGRRKKNGVKDVWVPGVGGGVYQEVIEGRYEESVI